MRSTRSRRWSSWRRPNEHHAPPPIPSLIPESAPFTPEQRTWLNGLFAGMISLEESVTPLSNEEAAKLLPGVRRAARRPKATTARPGTIRRCRCPTA